MSRFSDKEEMTRLIIFLFSFTLIWLPVQQAQAQLGPKTEMAVDAHLKLRLHSTLLRTQTQLDLKLGHLQSLQLPEEQFLAEWTKEFKLITNNYVAEQMENHSFDSRQISAVKRQLSKLNWQEFSAYFLKQVAHLKSFTRLSGVGLFSAVVLTNILQWIMPFVLSAIGLNPIWGIIMLQVPTTLPVIYAYQLATGFLYKMKLIKALGSREAYEQYKKIQKLSLQELNLKHIQDHILGLDQNGSAVIIARPNPLTQVSQMLGFKKDQLTLKTLKSFMQEQKIEDNFAWGIANDTQLKAQDKVAMILTHFQDSLEANQRAQLRLRFSDSFTIITRNVENWGQISSWVDQTIKSKSPQDLFYHLERMPDELRPQELSAIWEEILLPELSKNEQISYTQMRRAVKKFHAYKLEVEKLDHRSMTPQLREKFFDYFQVSMKTKKQGCFNTHQQVIETLLKSF